MSFPLFFVACVLASAVSVGLAQVELPEEAAMPAGSGEEAGFTVRLVQAPDGSEIGNHYLRAVRQLAGTVRDSAGFPVENVALPGPEPGGRWHVPVVNFSTDPDRFTGAFPDGDARFPGLEEFGQTTVFATEVVAWIGLDAGPTTFGISSGFARTDLVDDDGWRLSCGANPRGFFCLEVAEAVRSAPPFPSEEELSAGNLTVFTVVAPKAGLYPFRLVHWQQSGLAMLEWFRIRDPGGPTEQWALLNGEGEPVSAWRRLEGAPSFEGPYVAEVLPLPGAAGVLPTQPVRAVLHDGVASAVDSSSVQMTLNSAPLSADVTREGPLTIVEFLPDPGRPGPQESATIAFADESGSAITHTWEWSIDTPPPQPPAVSGQWDFDKADLRATTGAPLAFLSPVAAAATQFGTTRDFGLPDIDGQPALVMRVPGDPTGGSSRDIGYVMTHGVPPGGSRLANQYTLVMDILVDGDGPPTAALLQAGAPAADDPADLTWSAGNFGEGPAGTGTFTAGEWHRIAVACDMTARPPVVTRYVDGVKQPDWTAGHRIDDPRRALQRTALLFAGGPAVPCRALYVNSVQIRPGRLTDAQMVLLGTAEACGIPAEIATAEVSGQWDFNHAGLNATIGAPLEFLDGPTGMTQRGAQFGTPAEFGLPELPGGSAANPSRILRVPGDLSPDIGLLMRHGIAPNGGGKLVNRFTIVMDVFISPTGPPAAALLQTASPGNDDDGDLFWQGNNFGQGEGGYGGNGRFTAGEWHRVAAAYDMAANPPVVVKYVDGFKQGEWTAGHSLDDPRRALRDTAILFGDGDADQRRELFVNSIQFRPGRLGDAELALLGGPEPAGIPVALPATTVTGQWDFRNGNLDATVGSPLRYLDGDNGLTRNGTIFGTTAALGIPSVGTMPTPVMEVPGDLDRGIGYVMDHRIAPNGGGTLVNRYTLIMDVMVDADGPGAASMLQIDSAGNLNDGDLFWQGGNFGQGEGGYIGTGQFSPGEWHRVIAAYDLAASPPVVTKYVDGILQDEWTVGQTLDHPRRALRPTAILFADGDQDERRRWWVSSIQIRSSALTPGEAASLGGPHGSGIPIALPARPSRRQPRFSFGRGADRSFLFAWDRRSTGWALERSSDLRSWHAQGDTAASFLLLPAAPEPVFLRLRRNP